MPRQVGSPYSELHTWVWCRCAHAKATTDACAGPGGVRRATLQLGQENRAREERPCGASGLLVGGFQGEGG